MLSLAVLDLLLLFLGCLDLLEVGWHRVHVPVRVVRDLLKELLHYLLLVFRLGHMIVLQEELSEAQAPRSLTLCVSPLVEVLLKLFRLVFSGRLGLLAQASVLIIKRFNALILE